MPAGRPPLGLAVEVTDANGTTYRWDGSGSADNRPRGLGFGTKRGDGFGAGSVTLPRRIDRDYVDLNLLDSVVITADDGSVAYEGRVVGEPRTIDAGHSIQVQFAGWMTQLKRRKFQDVYVDPRLDQWQPMPVARRAALATTRTLNQDYTFNTEGGLNFDGIDAKAITNNNETEAWYAAPTGVALSKLVYRGTEANTANVVGATAYTAANDDLSGAGSSTGLTLDDVVRTASLTAARYMMLEARASATHTPAAAAGLRRTYKFAAVYGNQGLTSRTVSGEPDGFYVTDIGKDIIQRYGAKLSTASVQDSTFIAQFAAWLERTYPYDALLELNKNLLWGLECWEGRTIHWKPYDLSDYTWDVRPGEDGVRTTLQGDSVGDSADNTTFANGIVVTYVDLYTGRVETITPDTDSTLRDTNPNNPANKWGEQIWTEIVLSTPATSTYAPLIGRAALAEFNLPKAPGVIRIPGGYVRDRAGHWHQAWKIRAGQTLALSNYPNARPRLIGETEWDNDAKELIVAVDNTLPRIGAVLDRQTLALQANNLL